ncbi:MAG: DHH family phosphoesterase [Aminivibrio sp.]
MTVLCRADRLKIVNPTETARRLAERENCSLLAAAVIESRGEASWGQAFARPSLKDLVKNLDLGAGAGRAAERWKKMKNPGRALVYGDYDVDGAASTALAMEICRGSAKTARFFIPHRHEEGYGLHRSVIDQLLPMGWDTLIVVDCGSKDYEILEYAAASGVNVFVFDHHQPEEGRPLHPSVVNPHCGGGDEAAKSLCATGVLWAWAWKYGLLPDQKARETADLAALATLADCMPLGPLNKEIVREGIDSMRTRPGRGLARLFRLLELPPRAISEESLTMRVIPCLNAAGRMDIADTAVEVLLGGKGSEEGAEALVALNKKRQLLSGRISGEAAELLSGPLNHVALGEDWPVGVLSGVASRLCSVNAAPVALAAPVREGIRGTLRVPEGGDAIKVLDSISSLLDAWGGHQYAAGFSVSRSNWGDVSAYLEDALSSMELEEPEITVLAINPEDIEIDSWKEVAALGPFGNGNPPPLFYAPRRRDDQLLPLGKDGRHLQVDSGGTRLLAFNGKETLEAAPSPGGWVYRPRLDYWRGQERLQYIMDYVVVDELP